MILASSFALAVAQPPVTAPMPPPPMVTVPVPPRPTPPPNMTVFVPSPPPPPRIITSPITPRAAPAPLPEPSPAARQLAMRILERITIFDEEARRTVLNQLRWSEGGGRSCDFDNAECRRIAEEMAEREAPRLLGEMRSSFAAALGAQFQRTMSPAQIEEATRFFASEAGGAFIGSFMAVDGRSFAGLDSPSAMIRARRGELVAEFARRTQHLPRAQAPRTPMIMVPAPPAPPSPAAPPTPPAPPRP